jgi:hypothetical protein
VPSGRKSVPVMVQTGKLTASPRGTSPGP